MCFSEMREWFYFFDKNNDGQLDRDELKKVFHSVGWNATDEQFEKVFTSVDADCEYTLVLNVNIVYHLHITRLPTHRLKTNNLTTDQHQTQLTGLP